MVSVNRFQGRPPARVLKWLCVLGGLTFSAATQAGFVNYDFQSAAAQSALDGLVSGTFTADGVPLGVTAGIVDGSGSFTSGSDFLSANAQFGLGVNGEQIRDVRGTNGLFTTGVLFTLDSQFTDGTNTMITLNRYFSEDLLVYADGVLLGRLLGGGGLFNDFPSMVLDSPTGLTQVNLGSLTGITELLVTTSVTWNDDSDFYIAGLRGIPVAEPATAMLLGIGCLALIALRSRRLDRLRS